MTFIKNSQSALIKPGGAGAPVPVNVLLPITVDTYIFGFGVNTTVDNGVCTTCIAGLYFDPGTVLRGLMLCDVSSIPGTATVTAATLYAYSESRVGANPVSIGVHYGNIQWYEGNACASTHAGVNYSCHNFRNYNGSVSWPGGSATNAYNALAEATTVCGATTAWYTWNIAGLVQSWVNGSIANNGLWLVGVAGAGNSQYHRFSSRESATPANKPYIDITYTP